MTGQSLGFDDPVENNGYAWWYLDALSDDGKYGLTVIGFIGSVFSPYYARARRKAAAVGVNPLNHCAINVALYAFDKGQRRHSAWSMTERSTHAVKVTPDALQIGPSALEWDGASLVVRIDEVCAPWPQRIRGTVRLHPKVLLGNPYQLDATGLHQWTPIAPFSRVDVNMPTPGFQWTGNAYMDTNRGTRPLERDFLSWNWLRADVSDRRTALLYDVSRVDGSTTAVALDCSESGGVRPMVPPALKTLVRTRWALPRETRTEKPDETRVLQTMEDGPFYARSLLQTHLLGQPVKAVHESLSMQRWTSPTVQCMLPFRMPRRSHRS